MIPHLRRVARLSRISKSQRQLFWFDLSLGQRISLHLIHWRD
jgi:hypothetical protein